MTLRRKLVKELESNGSLTDPAVRRAFLAVPREHFLPAVAEAEGLAAIYADKAIVIRNDAHGAPTSSSSQPAIMAIMLERLGLAPGLRVLEIGAGTGYNAALLSTLVGAGGRVVSVELQPDLADAAAEALAAGGYAARVVTGDGREGWEAEAPYDRIILTASTGTVNRPWFDQLVPGGLLQLPFHLQGPDLQAVVTLRKEDDRLRSVGVVDGGFMALRDPAQKESASYRGSGVSVSEHIDGQYRALGSLTGEGLRRLRPAARRRLAALLLEKPRIRRAASGTASNGRSPGLFIGLSRPPGGVVARYFRSGLEKTRQWAVGVVTLDGRSLALLTYTASGGMRLESYGGAEAGDTLAALLADWRSRGCPGTTDLSVSVTYGDDGEPRTELGWPSPRP